ncbi:MULTISPECIES: ATP-binding protein [unclassified Streptomyces]|uniref:ATP-binding protein n=1 Tax=unclassified Streptomyces TaxID=2593676 RepID=UPI00211D1803|nr:ATP-binding protein [Streptomyces sp. b84]
MVETLPRVAVPVVSTPPAVRRRSSRRIGALVMIETGAGPMPAYTETLPRVANSAQRARRLIHLALDVWELTDVQDDAELVVSELVSNAVLHARRGDSVRVTATRLGEGRVRVAVVDLSRHWPAPSAAGDDQESGRGVGIVNALSGGRWGVDPLPWGKRVWAELGPAVAR